MIVWTKIEKYNYVITIMCADCSFFVNFLVLNNDKLVFVYTSNILCKNIIFLY